METYNVTGMSCAACSARVEKAVNNVEGVESCSVSLLTNSMGVTGSADPSKIIAAVIDAGYGASLKSNNSAKAAAPNYDDALKDTETPKMKKRLIASIILLIPLMYVSMGHMMWNWPLPGFLSGNHIAIGIYELVLTGLIMVINQKFFISGFKGLLHKAPNMDTLVALGATASFCYSLYALFAMTNCMVAGDMAGVMSYMDEFYFESAAMILTLITVGKMLEAMSKGKTTDALKGLMKLAPKTAILLINDEEVEVPIEDVQIGDKFVVRPGENVPVDGIVVDGESTIDESALTGESIPIDKEVGSKVSAATTNLNGYIVCQATGVGNDTTLAQIIQMVSDAAATKAPIAKIADKVSGIFVPTVISIALITFVIWLLVGQTVGYSLARAISVLVISCPCALGLATPVAIMVGNGLAAKNGIMFKTAVSLENAGKVQIVALDKTGTITKGEPEVIDYMPLGNISEHELFSLAYALEAKSEHPLAKAIVSKAKSLDNELLEVENFAILSGNGLSATYNTKPLIGGSVAYISSLLTLDSNILESANEIADKGQTPILFAYDNKLIGIIAVADAIKEDSTQAISQLKSMGIHVVMLTGDNQKTANAIGEIAGVDEVIAGVLPNEKADVVNSLKEYGKVAMVGDGINDAPALTCADIGIAIGAGTDIAIDAADIVLMKSSLIDAAAAIRLSRGTLTNIKENLFWAFFYNIIGIPLAAGAYIHLFGWTLNPMFGAAAMSLSSFCVVTNALRLNLYKLYDPTKSKKLKNQLGHSPLIANDASESKDSTASQINKEPNQKEDSTMEITVKGMMCQHCEAHVKEALEKLEGVSSATANHEENLVTLVTTTDVSESDIKAAVEGAGYEYAGLR